MHKSEGAVENLDEANVLSDCRTGRKRSKHGTTSVRETGELGKHAKQIYTISHPIFTEKKKSKRKLEE